MVSGTALKIWIFLKKIAGWSLIFLAAMTFAASTGLLLVGNYAAFAVGLIVSFLMLLLGLEALTDMEKLRNRIVGLMSEYFPTCPICGSSAGYDVRGWLSSSQYVQCKTCGAQWTSNDFVGYKDLKKLKLWEPPEDSKVYGKFMSQSVLKPRVSYPVKLWQSAMKGEKLQIPVKERSIKIRDFILFHRREVEYFTASLVVSFFSSFIGYHFFSLGIAGTYTLFVSTFFLVFLSLLLMRTRA
jgi:hypothetical protein